VLPEEQFGNIIDFLMRHHSHLRFQCIEIVIPIRKVWVWLRGHVLVALLDRLQVELDESGEHKCQRLVRG
jgi:hypothetical protein